MARISVDELQGLMAAGAKPVIVDVRSGVARKLDRRMIPGALPVEIGEVDMQIGHLPTDIEIILYCTCPNEETAARAAKMLIDRDYSRVRPLRGGLEAWIEAGYGLEDWLPASAEPTHFSPTGPSL